MRCGVLSDIHGNVFALRAAIDRLRRQGVDTWLCAGDVVGYGPNPNECVEVIAELGAICVVGNHEQMVLGRLPTESGGPLCRATTGWTRSVLHDDTFAFLSALPEVVVLDDLVMTHAALDSVDRYVKRGPQADAELRRLDVEHPDARFLVVGHTHYPWVRGDVAGTRAASDDGAVTLPLGERFLLNPGSVGQSRGPERRPLARAMVLDTDRAELRFHATAFDLDACRRALREHRLPYECIHQRRAVVPAARRRVRRTWQRLVAPAARPAGETP